MPLIAICGVPGSGKTVLSTAICSAFPDWVRISQDDLGSRPACEKACLLALQVGKSVIIDRCNFDKRQRKVWIDIAKCHSSESYALELNTPVDKCRHRILMRESHPTNVMGPAGAVILDQFSRLYQSPQVVEGFTRVYTINMTKDLEWTTSVLKVIMLRLGIINKT